MGPNTRSKSTEDAVRAAASSKSANQPVEPPASSSEGSAGGSADLYDIDLNTATQHQIAEVLKTLMTDFEDAGIQDDSLWDAFGRQSDKMEDRHWDEINTKTWELVKKFCYTNGVWLELPKRTKGARTPYSVIMRNALDGEEWYGDWTMEQIGHAESYGQLSRCMRYRKKKLMEQGEKAPQPRAAEADKTGGTEAAAAPSDGSQSDRQTSMYQRTSYLFGKGRQNQSQTLSNQPQVPPRQPQVQLQHQLEEQLQNQAQTASVQPQIPQSQPIVQNQWIPAQPAQSQHMEANPSINRNQYNDTTFLNPPYRPKANNYSDDEGIAPVPEKPPDYTMKLTQLDKIYRDDDKFGGTGDNFDYKLEIFREKCMRVGLPAEGRVYAISIMLKGQALIYYYQHRIELISWEIFTATMRTLYEGPEWQRQNMTKWQTITLNEIISANPTMTTSECLQKLTSQLDQLQQGIDIQLQGPFHLRENIIRACRGHPALQMGLTLPAIDAPALIANLHLSIANYESVHRPPTHGSYVQSYNEKGEEGDEAYFIDRQYRGRARFRGNFRGRSTPSNRIAPRSTFRNQTQQRCFVCDRVGCWSIKHPQHLRDEARKRLGDRFFRFKNHQDYNRAVDQFIIEYEGEEGDTGDDEAVEFFEQLLLDAGPERKPETYNNHTVASASNKGESFFTSFGALDNSESWNATAMLADQAFKHRITSETVTPSAPIAPYCYSATTESRYGPSEFKGLLIDSGAAIRSTGGIGQLKALQRLDNSVKLNETTNGDFNFIFGLGETKSIGYINLTTPMGQITFHIVGANTPFLLCLADLDRLGTYFNNITNQLIQSDRSFPVIRRYGHAFLPLHATAYSLIVNTIEQFPSYLTETELRRLHRRFGHPSVRRLREILERSGHDSNPHVLQRLTKYCEHCQKHGRSPGRFSFSIKEDVDFNYNIIVDILYIQNKPVLHLVDEATRFQTGRWLRDISAKHVWDQLRSCWIDTYLGPPDFITSDAGKQFVAREFKQYAINMGIIVKNVPVEAHHSIGKVERYHEPLRRIYMIIINEIPGIEPDLALQMSFKAINDSVGPNGLVPTLLVFGAYPRMVELDAPSPTITQRSLAMRKAMDEVRRLTATRQVNDALNTRNGPSTIAVHDLTLNSPVLVWREGNANQSGGWKGPYSLIGIERETAIIKMPNGPTKFRTTSVRPYEIDETATEEDEAVQGPVLGGRLIPGEDEKINSHQTPPSPPVTEENRTMTDHEPPSDDATPPAPAAPIKRGRGRPRKHPANIDFTSSDICFVFNNFSPEPPQFVASRHKEVSGLIEKGVFQLIDHQAVPPGARIFNSRFVDEIKHPGTEKAYEKSRLVVQAYNDQNKDLVLTQSPTIQRVSQRLILCLAATIPNTKLFLRDVTQAYVQSTSSLNRDFFIRPPPELATMLGAPLDCIMKVIKPLYGVPEAGNHWFATYHRHHTEALGMTESTYDSCFLFKHQPLGLVGLQTDDTLILADDAFATDEEEAIRAANFMTKQRDCLTIDHPIKFNGLTIRLDKNGDISLKQEARIGGVSLIKPINTSTTSARGLVRENLTPKDQYVAQRARGAYLASICQPEASFDLSYAAQSTEFLPDDIASLNKRLQWQIDNKSRGLKYVKLHPDSLQLVVFTDSSFANNKDLSSQVGYVICLADATGRANIIHWSSIKCKRVTRSVLASELYAMAHGFDLGAVIKATMERLFQKDVSLIICTDSKSLYDCLVRLGTTQEKRLMIDVMSLRQSYERREITEVRWIDGDHNPADSMTKSKGSNALKALVDTNRINLDAMEWVERAPGTKLGDDLEKPDQAKSA